MTVAQARVTTLDAVNTSTQAWAEELESEEVLRSVLKQILLFKYEFGMLQKLPKSSRLIDGSEMGDKLMGKNHYLILLISYLFN